MSTPFPSSVASPRSAANVLKVLVSRPAAAKTDPPRDVRGPDCCWTEDGEILVPTVVGCDPRPGHTEWAFIGMRTASAATWGVVEWRSSDSVVSAVTSGKYAADWEGEEGFPGFIFADLRDVAARIRDLPTGAVVGVFGTTADEYCLVDRTPPTTVR
jgi:hypothetical protein